MTQPHQCRCAICGMVGVITPALINPFALDPPPYPGEERRKTPIVPTGTTGDAAYASSRADELAPRNPPEPRDNKPYADVPTCTHGYTRCMPCKFPPEPLDVVTPVG